MVDKSDISDDISGGMAIKYESWMLSILKFH